LKTGESYRIGMPLTKGMRLQSPVSEVVMEVKSCRKSSRSNSFDVEVFQVMPEHSPSVVYSWSVPRKAGAKSRFDLGGWYVLSE
jgi:hypothetical protein